MSDSINQIIKLAEEMIEIEKQIEKLKIQLEVKQDHFKRISRDELPVMMGNIGLSSFALDNNISIIVKPILNISLPVIDQSRVNIADEWLTKHGHKGMVKTNIDVSLPKASERLPEIQKVLNDMKVEYSIKKAIHPMTLKGWANEMERNNMVIPEDIFTVYRYNITVIE